MKNIILSILTLSLFNACTKVIDIDLNTADAKIVIEAELLSGTQNFEVTVTKTGNYFDANPQPTIANAIVSLKKGNEAPIELDNSGNGKYTLPNFTATENTTYLLSVTADGKTYEATSFLPKVVPLDSIVVTKADDQPFGSGDNPDTFQIYCHFQDPALESNYYRLKSSANGIPRTAPEKLLIIEDRLTNGNRIQIPIFTDTYELNDDVEVSLVSMDKAMFDYFNTLALLVGGGGGGGGTAAPANPNTNWSGGALGYFGAFSVSKLTVLVK